MSAMSNQPQKEYHSLCKACLRSIAEITEEDQRKCRVQYYLFRCLLAKHVPARCLLEEQEDRLEKEKEKGGPPRNEKEDLERIKAQQKLNRLVSDLGYDVWATDED